MQTYRRPLVKIANGVTELAPQRAVVGFATVAAGSAGTPGTVLTLDRDRDSQMHVISTLDTDVYLTLAGVIIDYIKAGSDHRLCLADGLQRFDSGQLLGAYPVATGPASGNIVVVLT